MANRKVIFVGGSSYSGSTLLDMLLSNSEKGFSCGEINALFYPYRQHHKDYSCGCGDPDCHIWEKVRSNGVVSIYTTIFDMFPDVEYVVDSSKDPIWIHKQSKILKDLGIDVRNILIWKTPEEFFISRSKRSRNFLWGKAWVNYHKLYFRLIKYWASIKYKDLVEDKSSLKEVCEYLDIEYFQGKEEYWQGDHHTLFGNTSAKVHLYREDSKVFDECQTELSKHTEVDAVNEEVGSAKHRSIYYESPAENRVEQPGLASVYAKIQDVLNDQKVDGVIEGKRNAVPQSSKAGLLLYAVNRIKFYMRPKVFFIKKLLLTSG